MNISHIGPDRTNATLQQASELLHTIASSIALKDEFELVYEKSEAGSRLVLQMIPPLPVEAASGVVVDSESNAAINVDAAQPIETTNAKTTRRNGSPKPPTA